MKPANSTAKRISNPWLARRIERWVGVGAAGAGARSMTEAMGVSAKRGPHRLAKISFCKSIILDTQHRRLHDRAATPDALAGLLHGARHGGLDRLVQLAVLALQAGQRLFGLVGQV